MNKNLLKLIAVYGAACFLAYTVSQRAETKKWNEHIVRSEMQRSPEPWMIEKVKKPRRGYTHGLIVRSVLEEWKRTGDSAYYGYAKIYTDGLIDADGHIKVMKYLSFGIDNVSGERVLFDLYTQTGDERYKIAMGILRKQMAEQPRTSGGGLWHRLGYPHQMWLDGIFIASPYLVQYGATFDKPTLFSEVAK